MKILGIIPARYASTRFEGKPLAKINGKTMICRVAERASQASLLSDVIVATDDTRIAEEVVKNGFHVMMTSDKHPNGTARCAEVASKNTGYEAVINIQGDEPFIDPEQIDTLARVITQSKADIATLVKVIKNEKELFSPNVVKAVIDARGNALYFSRQAIPHLRGIEQDKWLESHTFYKHIGIYAYRADILQKIVGLPQTPLEKAESLEQLRWLENGLTIATAVTANENIAIDTPDDLVRAERYAQQNNL